MTKVLDGFIELIDSMGDDYSFVQSARISYAAGTKIVNNDRGLIRYLVRHGHMSPFEQASIKVHIKAPIFVLAQWKRHKGYLNELSARYSVVEDDMFIPEPNQMKKQSTDNMQGRDILLSGSDTESATLEFECSNKSAYETYEALLDTGLARELARTVLPVGTYTRVYWTQTFRDAMFLCKARLDPHAQYEIRILAQAYYDILKELFPIAVEAFDDYVINAVNFSKQEMIELHKLLQGTPIDGSNLSKRELIEFKEKIGVE